MTPIVELAREWMKRAEDDLRMAQIVLVASPPVPWGSAFHAQQAAEKFLKAFLVSHQIEFEKVHLITYLLDLCVGVEPQAESLRPAAPRLTVFAVDARYPFPEQEITEEMAREAVQLARQVREFVLERLPKDARK